MAGAPGPQPVQSDQRTVVRRQPLIARIAGYVSLVLGVLLVLLAVLLGISGEVTGLFVCLGMGAVFLAIAPAGLRPRLVLDASGLHVRGVLRSHDLPWPASRGVLVAREQYNRGSIHSAVAEYRPDDGSRPVKILMLRHTDSGIGNAAAAVEADIDELWEWAVACGYVRPSGVPGRLAPAGGPGPASAPGAPVAPGGPAPLIDPALLGREPLELRPKAGLLLAISVPIIALIAGGGVYFVVMEERAVMGVCAIILAIVLAVIVLDSAMTRAIIDRRGIEVVGLRRRALPWPASRSQLVVTIEYHGRTAAAQGFLVGADGKHVRLPVVGRRGDLSPELDAVRVLDTIWAWGLQRGATSETGQYVVAADLAFERRRRTSAERVAYLRRGR